MSAVLRHERRGPVVVLTLARPHARNAVDAAMARAIEDAIDAAEADDGVRVVVLAADPPVFCAGADLREIAAGRGDALNTARGGFAGICRRSRAKPLIAAVDGPALAGGTEIVLAADLVVASSAAAFGLPEPRRGLVAGAGGLFRLAQRVALNVAMEYAITGATMDAARAYELGLVNRLCAPGAAVDVALELAQAVCECSPLAVRYSREVLLATVTGSDEPAWRLTRSAFEAVEGSADAAEGVAAFLERRKPVWKGAES
jgi:enoyl-CoA hydratase